MQGPQNELLSRENLKRLYVDNPDASLADVAKEVGSHRETVRRWVVRYGFPIKPKSRPGKPKKEATVPLANRDWLHGELKTKNCVQIAHELGVPACTAYFWAHKHGLVERDMSKSEAVKRGYAKKYPDGRFGEKAGNWQGGRRVAPGGYVYIYTPGHPRATKAGYVMEHRLVMEEQLGRTLESNEVIHHKDGDKKNNVPENLEVLTRSEHVSVHFDAAKDLHQANKELHKAKLRIAELEAKLEAHDNTI